MFLVDHQRLLVNLPHQVLRHDGLFIEGRSAAVSPCKEEKLLHQVIHVVGLVPDRGDPLIQRLFICFSPALQHIRVSLDHSDRCPQLMGGVVDKAGLLPHRIPHAQKQVIHRRFHAGQICVAKRQRSLTFRLLRMDVLDRVFNDLIFVFREG